MTIFRTSPSTVGSRIAVLALCAVPALLRGLASPSKARGEVDYYSLLEVLDSREKTLQSLCISGRYQITTKLSQAQKQHPYAWDNDTYRVDFDCDFPNRRWRYDERKSWLFSKFSQEPFEIRHVSSHDGKSTYRLAYTFKTEPTGVGFPPERVCGLDIQNAEYQKPAPPLPRQLTRTIEFNGNKEATLGDLFRNAPSTWMGLNRIGGDECYRVTVRPLDGRSRIDVWVDADHGFLLRRWKSVRLDDSGQPKLAPDIIENLAFREFPLAGGGHIWFPTRAVHHTLSGSEKTLEIKELKISESLPLERFQVDLENLPPGVYVTDRCADKSYYTGGDEGQRLYEEWQRLNNAQHEVLKKRLGVPASSVPLKRPPFVPPKKADQDDGHSVWFMTNVCLLALLAGGWVLYQFRRRWA